MSDRTQITSGLAHVLAIYDSLTEREVVSVRLTADQAEALKPYLYLPPDAVEPHVACYPVRIAILDCFLEGATKTSTPEPSSDPAA